MSCPHNIILDFGGVLMKHDKAGCLNDLRQLMSDEDITKVLGFGTDKDDTLRARFEIGACDTRYFLDQVLRICKPGTTVQQVIDAWNKIHAGIPDEAWETIPSCRTTIRRLAYMRKYRRTNPLTHVRSTI